MSNNADAAVKDALTNILNKPDHMIDNNGISRVMIRSLLLDGPQADSIEAASCSIGAFADKEHNVHRDDDASNHHDVTPSTTTSKLYHQLRGCLDVHCTQRYLGACKSYNNITVEETIEIT